MLDQSRAFCAYYFGALKIIKSKTYDMVFATSSRLFTAFLGARIARQRTLPLYLDVRDIFLDTIKDVLPRKVSFLLQPALGWVERYTFRRAKHINLVSQGFEEYFRKRYPKASYSLFTNGIDKEFIEIPSDVAAKSMLNKPLRVLYAGNIGEGQGLQAIVPPLAQKLSGVVHFRIIGDGGRKKEFCEATKHLPNIEILPPVSRKCLIEEYRQADILFLHLNNYPAFSKVLPSKIFEYAALGKPVWAGVTGYAAEFLNAEVLNVAVFCPGHIEEAIKGLEQLSFELTPRTDFIKKYNRQKIMREMAEGIVEAVD